MRGGVRSGAKKFFFFKPNGKKNSFQLVNRFSGFFFSLVFCVLVVFHRYITVISLY